MSYRQCIWVAHPVNVEAYLAVLEKKYNAMPHPNEPGSFLIGDPPLPFYAPRLIDNQLAITSFNHVPLSPVLLKALHEHPELAPPQALVRWTEEQELVIRGSLEQVSHRFRSKER